MANEQVPAPEATVHGIELGLAIIEPVIRRQHEPRLAQCSRFVLMLCWVFELLR